jgi:hypothetical protein
MLSGVYRFPQMESVVFGKPFAEALAQKVDRSVFVLASGTLSRETDLVERLRQVLGNRFAGSAPRLARIRRVTMSSLRPIAHIPGLQAVPEFEISAVCGGQARLLPNGRSAATPTRQRGWHRGA